jgi:peptidoglycan/xylan/chitin deacetylase (PgdA/CDA1 family)
MNRALLLHGVVKKTPTRWTEINQSNLCYILDFLLERGLSYNYIGHNGDKEKIMISFDDGLISDYSIVFPEVSSRELCASFFIVPSWVGKKGYMDWSMIREMFDSGLKIGSHSFSHQKFNILKEKEIRIEMDYSKKILEDKLGAEIKIFAYPYGLFTKESNNIALEVGYKRIYNSLPGLYNSDDILIPRLSIHSNHNQEDLKKLMSSSSSYIYYLQFFNKLKNLGKEIVGDNNYLALRRFLFK